MTSNTQASFDMNDREIRKAYEIAVKVHDGHVDKAGRPYIEHVMTVANKMNFKDGIIVALLHDVLEDTDLTAQDLKSAGFSYEVITGLIVITKKTDEEYEDYLNRVKHNRTALLVKIADLEHNSDLSRLEIVTEEAVIRLSKYEKATEFLSTFVCEKCNETFPAHEMGEKITRSNEIFCKSCLDEYEMVWDEYEDWLKTL